MTGQICVRCDRVARSYWYWPEGRICRTCYNRATANRGTCPGCGQNRLLPGLADGAPVCVDCAGIPKDFYCSRCGTEDAPYRAQLCTRCSLRDDLGALLDDGSGNVLPELVPLYEALCEQPRPMSAMIWLRNPQVKAILAGMASRKLPVTHETFDAYGSERSARHLRELLMKHGVLPNMERELLIYRQWLESKLSAPGIATEHARVVRRYAIWHHLRRMRALAERGELRDGHLRTSTQDTTVALELLAWLGSRNVAAADCSQADIDSWIATGPSTRSRARSFVVWAIRNRHMPNLEFPIRATKSHPQIDQARRLDLLLALLQSDEQLLVYRVAAIFFLLYGQPVTRIVRLTVDDISVTETAISVTFGDHPMLVPEPFAQLVRQYLPARPNISTASNADSPYLFTGSTPGRPMSSSYLAARLRSSGIDLRAARAATMIELVQEIPPPVAARALGFAPHTLERFATQAGNTWANYPAIRRSTRKNS